MSRSSTFFTTLETVGNGWYHAKTFVEHAIAFSDDALHIWAGVLIQLLAAALLRRSLGSWWAWSAVLVLELANEAVDLWVERWPDLAQQLGEGGKDIVLTLLLPSLLLLISRRWPRLLAGRK